MIRRRHILFFGLWLMILAFLGVPSFWKNALLLVSGGLLVLIAFYLRFKNGNIAVRNRHAAYIDNGGLKTPQSKQENSLQTDAQVANPQP